MLTPLLGLDVVIEEDSGEPVLIEVNGEWSGYGGILDLTESNEFAKKIVSETLRQVAGQRVLFDCGILRNPGFPINGRIKVPDRYRTLADLIKQFEVTPVFAPFVSNESSIPGRFGGIISTESLETILRTPLASFGGIIGLGYALPIGIPAEEKMLNPSSVELNLGDKRLTHMILDGAPGIRMAPYDLVWLIRGADELRYRAAEDPNVLYKFFEGSQGNGIARLTPQVASKLDEAMESKRKPVREILGLYGLDSELLDCRDFLTSFSGIKPENREMMLSLFYNQVALLERIVRTKPVRNKEDTGDYVGCARLLWMGDYLGGYWRLSKDPIESDDPENIVVNYSTSEHGRLFTDRETEFFRGYVNHIAPTIWSRLQPYVGNKGSCDKLQRDMVRKGIEDTEKARSIN
jgi:hypothetical protein